MDKVSIIIIAFNSASSLPKCINSCLTQSYKNIEIVIVIDGSPDNSFEIAKFYQQKDSRILVINKENEGIPKTRKVGFDRSSGDFIYHLDADDYIESNTIEVLLQRLYKEDADIVISGLVFEDKDGKFITNWITSTTANSKVGYLKDIFTSRIPPFIFGRLIRREIFNSVFVTGNYNCGEDFVSNIMMICYNSKIKIVSDPALLHHYLIYETSVTNASKPESFMIYTDDICEILKHQNLEEAVINEWAYFRVIKSWRYYLRRGGKEYLRNKVYVRNFYKKYYAIIRSKLTITERFELNLYRYNQFLGYNFSRVYSKILRISKQPVN